MEEHMDGSTSDLGAAWSAYDAARTRFERIAERLIAGIPDKIDQDTDLRSWFCDGLRASVHFGPVRTLGRRIHARVFARVLDRLCTNGETTCRFDWPQWSDGWKSYPVPSGEIKQWMRQLKSAWNGALNLEWKFEQDAVVVTITARLA